jgi:hypothetical protein
MTRENANAGRAPGVDGNIEQQQQRNRSDRPRGVQALLDRLDAVHQVGAGRWRACCPAHDSQNRNVLSIAETTDGTVLIKCFHGCTADEVVRAVGLHLSDLFPRIDWQTTGAHYQRPRRPRVDWSAVMAACERDLVLVCVALYRIGTGEPIKEADAKACREAAERMFALFDEARHA